MSPYEFALVRYRHDLDAGEFANIGVVLLDVAERRLLVRMTERYSRLSAFFGQFNGSAYRSMLRHIEASLRRAEERLKQPDVFDTDSHSLASLLAEHMPVEDSCLIASTVMSGTAAEPGIRLEQLFAEFVEKYDVREEKARRDDDDVRRDVQQGITRQSFSAAIKWAVQIQGPNYSYEFQAGWRNGRAQVLEPISFDLADGRYMVEKAVHWTGRLANLSQGADFGFSAVVAPPTGKGLKKHFDRAMTLLRDAPNVREIFEEGHSKNLYRMIESDVTHAG